MGISHFKFIFRNCGSWTEECFYHGTNVYKVLIGMIHNIAQNMFGICSLMYLIILIHIQTNACCLYQ